MHTKSVNGAVMLRRMQSFIELTDSPSLCVLFALATDVASVTDEGGS